MLPFGTGMLYVKKDKIDNLWPYFPDEKPQGGNISKMENLGTRSVPSEIAIGQAINFHTSIGADRKQKRLHELKNYWLTKVKDLPRVTSYTSTKDGYSCALASVGIEGLSGSEFSGKLHSKYKIHTTNVKIEKVDGVRITPHVYTRFEDLDRLVSAIEDISAT